jgi:glycosyltransferase involved in cell wall biosynthesis
MANTKKRHSGAKGSPRIAIIMPAYNEGDTIGSTISEINEKIISRLPGTRLLVFEDGSKDNTKAVLRRLASKYKWLEIHLGPDRLGYPRAVKNAFASVDPRKFDYILFTDSDGQYDPSDFFKLLSVMKKGEFDMVVAQRKNRAEPFYRVILSKGLHVIERSLFNIKYYDITSAFRLMDPKVAKQIASEVKFSNYNFWLEFTARASKKKVSTDTIQVSYREREGGGSTKVYQIGKIPKIVSNEFSALIRTKLEG